MYAATPTPMGTLLAIVYCVPYKQGLGLAGVQRRTVSGHDRTIEPDECQELLRQAVESAWFQDW